MSSFDFASFEFRIYYEKPDDKQWLIDNIDDDLNELVYDWADIDMEPDPDRLRVMWIHSQGVVEISTTFDVTVKELCAKLREHGLSMEGFVRCERDGRHYRGDIDKDGNIIYEDLDVFADYPVWMLRKLKLIADDLKQH